MHPDTINTLSGPDFLQAMADTEAGDDRLINADAYRTRARQWQRDLDRIDALETELAQAKRSLSIASASAARRTPIRHAITPSGNR